MINEDYRCRDLVKELEGELGRYSIIRDYYKKYPKRAEIPQNALFLGDISDRLVEISLSEEISEDIRKESDSLLEFFGIKSGYI